MRKLSWLLGIFALVCGQLLLAQTQLPTENKEYARQVTPGALDEATYKRMERVYNWIGDEKYVEAKAELEKMLGRKRKPYAKAMMYQTLAHVFSAMENIPESVRNFEKAVASNTLPNRVHYDIMFMLVQFYFADEELDKTGKLLAQWFKEVPHPGTSAYILRASLNQQLKKYRPAISDIKVAIEISDKPKESWYRLLLGLHYQLKEYKEAAKVLEILVGLYPEKVKYWTQLSQLYLELKADEKALATLALAYLKGLLVKERDFLQLSNLYRLMEIPYKGAQILNDGLTQGNIEPSKKHWKTAAEAWFSAQEIDKAIIAYSNAAKLSTDGKMDMHVAYLYLDKEDFNETAKAAKLALKKGGLKKDQDALMILGMANFELGEFEASINAFKRCRRIEKCRSASSEWIRHVQAAIKNQQTS